MQAAHRPWPEHEAAGEQKGVQTHPSKAGEQDLDSQLDIRTIAKVEGAAGMAISRWRRSVDKHGHIISAARRRLARGAATVLLALACGVLGGLESGAQTLSADPGIKPNAPLDPNRPLAQELNTSTGSSLSMQAVGSLTISTAALPAFDPAVVALLTGSAQPTVSYVTVADLETSLFDSSFKGYPYGPDGSRPLSAGPGVAGQLKTLGLDLLSRANEHALDWGIDGMQATGAALDAAALIHAGTGLTGGQARSARYYDDPAGRGRIAFISAASTFRPTSEALQAQGPRRGILASAAWRSILLAWCRRPN
jgi:hypothetical protein